MGMAELIDKWELVSKLITLQNNYNFFKNEWNAERLYREIAKLEIEIAKTPGVEAVLCKDCKHWVQTDDVGYCDNPDGLDNYARPNDFCSYRERRTDETKTD